MSQSAELKKLRKHWYQKLKDAGFEDIEDNDSPREYLKSWSSSLFTSHAQREAVNEALEARKEYYEKGRRLLDQYFVIEKEIWSLHIEGHPIREIVRILNANGNRTYQKEVYETISRLRDIMLKRKKWA